MAPRPYELFLSEPAYLPNAQGELAKRWPLMGPHLRCIGQLAAWEAATMCSTYGLIGHMAALGVLSHGLTETEQNTVESILTALRVQDTGSLQVFAEAVSNAWGDIGAQS